MKITRLRTAVVEANYDWTFIRIETDRDLAGTGECFFAPGLTAILRDLEPVLIGEDPRDINRLFRRLQRGASGAGSVAGLVYNAISGVEAALWDLKGKALGAPVWELLGGKFRERVRMYADCHAGAGLESIGPMMLPRAPEWFRRSAENGIVAEEELTPAAHAARARQAVRMGFDALKFDLDAGERGSEERHQLLMSREIEAMQERVAAVRADVGPDVDLALDCHWRYAMADVIRIARACEPFNLLWLEDPLPPYNPASFLSLRQASAVPLCTGENLYLCQGFRELIQQQAVHIVSPDIQKTGGLAEARRIAEYADMYDLAVAPHCIASPIGTMAAVHLCASISNFVVLEFHGQDVPFWEACATGFEPPLIRQGSIEVPTGPGLGIELNEEIAREYRKPGEPFFV
jgi:L-alanine-DL-glutamate epimerase-like enolase superfamily enzyme